MKIGSLFSGIGGLELGLERAGVGHTVWQVEQSEFCRQVLAKHWPDATRYEDVTTTDWGSVEPVDVICGGFPCQPFSSAGKQHGTQDDRWLWPAYEDAVRVLRPRFVVVENVPALLLDRSAFGTILAGLYALGYEFEWSTVSACSLGAPHRRSRLFILADSNRAGWGRVTEPDLWPQGRVVAPLWNDLDRQGVARERQWNEGRPGSLGMADGLPGWVERRRALGNAVVPQVAEVVGRRLLELAA